MIIVSIRVTEMQTEQYFYANDVAKKLGLKGGRMVSELVQKHFGVSNVLFDVEGVGGRQKKLYKLNRRQFAFVLSRSRGDVSRCANHFGLPVSDVVLMRNEVLFTSIVKGMLGIVDVEYETQYKVKTEKDLYLLDMIVYGAFGCCVIEYDEKSHKYNKKEDDARDKVVINEVKKALAVNRVEIIRVQDNSNAFVSAISRIHALIHGDFFHPVCYKDFDFS